MSDWDHLGRVNLAFGCFSLAAILLGVACGLAFWALVVAALLKYVLGG